MYLIKYLKIFEYYMLHALRVGWRLKKKLTCEPHTSVRGGRETQQGYFRTYRNTVG